MPVTDNPIEETDERGVPVQPDSNDVRGGTEEDPYEPQTKKEKLAKAEAKKVVKSMVQKYGFEVARWALWEEVRYREHEND